MRPIESLADLRVQLGMVKEAVVLLNMGGPNSLEEVGLFLRNMFNDANILRIKNRYLRAMVANLIVARREQAAQQTYQALGGSSPLVAHTKALCIKLQAALGKEVAVEFAMRYTPPFAKEVADRLEAMDVRKLYLIPLYPHYSTTTTKSSIEDFKAAYEALGGNAAIYTIANFYRHPSYNRSLIERIKEALKADDPLDYTLILSAHSLPQRIVDSGDPYQKQIESHVKLLAKQLAKASLEFGSIELAYQSRLGPVRWLEPSLERLLRQSRPKKALILPLSFTLDNSETMHELHIEYAALAKGLGVEVYRVVACPNDHPYFVDALVDIYSEMRR